MKTLCVIRLSRSKCGCSVSRSWLVDYGRGPQGSVSSPPTKGGPSSFAITLIADTRKPKRLTTHRLANVGRRRHQPIYSNQSKSAIQQTILFEVARQAGINQRYARHVSRDSGNPPFLYELDFGSSLKRGSVACSLWSARATLTARPAGWRALTM
jgi:hypothetical protein